MPLCLQMSARGALPHTACKHSPIYPCLVHVAPDISQRVDIGALYAHHVCSHRSVPAKLHARGDKLRMCASLWMVVEPVSVCRVHCTFSINSEISSTTQNTKNSSVLIRRQPRCAARPTECRAWLGLRIAQQEHQRPFADRVGSRAGCRFSLSCVSR